MAIPTVTTTSVTSVTTTSCYAYANMTNTGGTPLAWRGIGYKDITTGGGENTIWVSDYYGSGDPPGSYGCTIGVGYFLLVPGHNHSLNHPDQ